MSTETVEGDMISDAYARATRINARLASRYDANLVSEGKQLASSLLEHVKTAVDDYDDFVARVLRSEEFTLHDSARMPKNERDLKIWYLRACDLLETIAQAEARQSKRR